MYLKLPHQPKPIKYKNVAFHAEATQSYNNMLSYGKNACYDNGVLFFIDHEGLLVFIDCNDPFPLLKGAPRPEMLPEITTVQDIGNVELLCSRNRRIYIYAAPTTLTLLENNEESVFPIWNLDTQNPLTAIVPVKQFLAGAQLIVERPMFEVSLVLFDTTLSLIYSVEVSTSVIEGASPHPITMLRSMRHSSMDLLAAAQCTKDTTIIYVAAVFRRKLYLLGSKRVNDTVAARDLFAVGVTGEVFLVGIELLVKFKVKF